MSVCLQWNFIHMERSKEKKSRAPQMHIVKTFWFLFTWQQYCEVRQYSSDINISASCVSSIPTDTQPRPSARSPGRHTNQMNTSTENEMIWNMYNSIALNCNESDVEWVQWKYQMSVFQYLTFCFLRGILVLLLCLIAYYVSRTLKNVPFNEQTTKRWKLQPAMKWWHQPLWNVNWSIETMLLKCLQLEDFCHLINKMKNLAVTTNIDIRLCWLLRYRNLKLESFAPAWID